MNPDPSPTAGTSTVTLRDIARKIGISHSAVALALQDSPRISLSRRIEVQKNARIMGYSPNPMATALGYQRQDRKKQTLKGEIAWLNHWGNPAQLRRHKEFDLYWQGASQSAEKSGYRLEEFVCDASLPLPRLESVLSARNISGILILPHRNTPPDLMTFNWNKFAVVRFGYSVSRLPVHMVTSNQLANAILAFESIRENGYERIGYVTSHHVRTRFKAGFLMAQSELPLSLQIPPLILSGGDPNSEDQHELVSWLETNRPGAILTDLAAMRAMLESAGLLVPRDIGLATLSILDGNADAGIYQNSEHIGKAAVEMLLSLIHHNHQGIPQVRRELLIEGRWVNGSTLPRRCTVLPGQ